MSKRDDTESGGEGNSKPLPISEEDDCFDANELEHGSAVRKLSFSFIVEEDEIPQRVGDGDVVDDGKVGVGVGGEVEVCFTIRTIEIPNHGKSRCDRFEQCVLQHPSFASQVEITIERKHWQAT